jgi:RimJ/RimL family protein N-acetyltransferase
MRCDQLELTPEMTENAARLAALIPVIETERLRLRAPRLSDWSALEPIWTGSRARHIGGPFEAETGWHDFCHATASWLLRGIGFFTVEHRTSEEILGFVGVTHEWGDAELELGWLLTDAAEGHGYATEAAIAARDHAYKTAGLGPLVSYVDRGNRRSVALAKRLGATPDKTAVLSGPNDDGETIAFRHPAAGTAP